jgi:Ca2+-binding RTX toxin-like protein
MADLIPQQVTIDGTLVLPGSIVSKDYLPGDQIALEWQVWNQDSGSAASNNTGIYVLSAGNVVEVSHFNNVSALSGNAKDTFEASTITLPNDLAPGRYTVRLVADANGDVPETIENNNFWTFQIDVVEPDEPDLIIQQVEVDGDLVLPNAVAPTEYHPGDTIDLDWQVWNQDAGPAPSSDTGIYLVSPGNVPLVSRFESVGALDGFDKDISESDTLTLPSNLTPGRYTIRLAADARSEVDESTEGNNFYAIQIDVVEPDEPDLIIQQVEVDGDLVLPNAVAPTEYHPGDTIDLDWQVWNQDAGPAPSSDTGIYLVSPGNVPLVSRFESVGAIDGFDKDINESDTLTLPSNLTPGRYTIRLAADARSEVNESTEGNNFYAVKIDVVDKVINTAPAVTIEAGATFTTGTVLKGTDLISVTDADGASDILNIYVYDAIDSPGAEWRFNGTAIDPGNGDNPFPLNYDNLALLKYTVGTGSDTFSFEAIDYAGNRSAEAIHTITAAAAIQAPTVTILAGSSYAAGTVLTGTDLFSADDPDGISDIDHITLFDDDTTGGAVWRYDGSIITPGGAAEGGYSFDYANRNLLTYTVGTGANDFVFEAFDKEGKDSNDALHTIMGMSNDANAAPVVKALARAYYEAGTVLTGSQLFAASDADGAADIDHIVLFDANQTGGAVWQYDGNFITPGGLPLGGFEFDYSNRDLLTYTVGTGPNDFLFEAFDNTGHDSNDALVQITGSSPTDTPTVSYRINGPSSVDETAGMVTFTIYRTGSFEPETVYVRTVSGRNHGLDENDKDYAEIANPIAMEFAGGADRSPVTIVVHDDETLETQFERFGLVVESAANPGAGEILAQRDWSIADDDQPVSVQDTLSRPLIVDLAYLAYDSYSETVPSTATDAGWKSVPIPGTLTSVDADNIYGLLQSNVHFYEAVSDGVRTLAVAFSGTDPNNPLGYTDFFTQIGNWGNLYNGHTDSIQKVLNWADTDISSSGQQFQRMIVIGHSMGGILTEEMLSDPMVTSSRLGATATGVTFGSPGSPNHALTDNIINFVNLGDPVPMLHSGDFFGLETLHSQAADWALASVEAALNVAGFVGNPGGKAAAIIGDMVGNQPSREGTSITVVPDNFSAGSLLSFKAHSIRPETEGGYIDAVEALANFYQSGARGGGEDLDFWRNSGSAWYFQDSPSNLEFGLALLEGTFFGLRNLTLGSTARTVVGVVDTGSHAVQEIGNATVHLLEIGTDGVARAIGRAGEYLRGGAEVLNSAFNNLSDRFEIFYDGLQFSRDNTQLEPGSAIVNIDLDGDGSTEIQTHLEGTFNLERFFVAPSEEGTRLVYSEQASTISSDLSDVLIGDSRDETIWGGAGDDFIFGLAGNDRLFGGPGNDLIEGGAGEDALWGYAGQDTLNGGADSDQVSYRSTEAGNIGPNGVTVNLAAGFGIDTWGDVDTYISIERAAGTDHADVFIGNNADNVFRGFDGADSYDGGVGGDAVRFDFETGGAGAFVDLAAGVGIDTYGNAESFTSIEYLRGSEWADEFLGNGEENRFLGLDGADYFDGRGGETDWVRYSFDVLYGGTASVTVRLDQGWAIDGFGQTDTFIGIERARGTDQDDTFIGSTSEDNVFEGLGGTDYFDGGAGSFNTVFFHQETGANGVVVDLELGSGTDSYGNVETYLNIGGLRGSQNNDSFFGDDDNNVFRGIAGEDFLDGRGGNDWARYDRDVNDGGVNGVTVDLDPDRNLLTDDAFAIDGFGDRDTLRSIERIRGSNFNDDIRGSDLDNILQGIAGNDTIHGGAGDDLIEGGAGDDRILDGDGNDTVLGEADDDYFVVGAGSDQFDGGTGIDWIDFQLAGPSGISVDLRLAIGQIINDGFGTTDSIVSIEGFNGSSFDDLVYGSDESEELRGFLGDDEIHSGGGNDILVGENYFEGAEAGDDRLFGDDGNDIIIGDYRFAPDAPGGDDEMSGGAGNDYLEGGPGNDILRGGLDPDELHLGTGHDKVMGTVAELQGDIVYDFGIDDVLIVEGANFGASDIAVASGSAILDIDSDRNGEADLSLTLEGDYEGARFLASFVNGNTEITFTYEPEYNQVASTEDSDYLVGTDGPDELRSSSGSFDRMSGGFGGDIFVFGAETRNGIRERDVIEDYEVGVDAIRLEGGATVGSIRESSSGVVIFFEGDNDAAYIQGDGVTASNIDIVNDDLFVF